MILQNDTPWLGGDGIGESLIPNQDPVRAGRTVDLSSFFCLLELRQDGDAHSLEGCQWNPVLVPLLGPFYTGPWDPEPTESFQAVTVLVAQPSFSHLNGGLNC